MSLSISVIIPVYNSEKYLEKCIDSILGQTFQDFELLLIDDGSTDSSGEICDRYAVHDSRIKVLHKPNGGVSSARNIGIELALGDWITFVDSDDWVESNYLSTMISHVVDGVDIVISYPRTFTPNSYDLPAEHYEGLISAENFSLLFSECGMGKYTYSVTKLYRRTFINKEKLRFDETLSMGEDHIFLYQSFLKARSVYVSKSIVYNYRYVEGGLSKRTHDLDVEVYGYKQIRTIIPQVIEKFGIANQEVMAQFQAVYSLYIYRVLLALYNGATLATRGKRLKILRSLELSYLGYGQKCSFWKRRMLNLAFCRFCLPLYDSVRVLQYKFRHKART